MPVQRRRLAMKTKLDIVTKPLADEALEACRAKGHNRRKPEQVLRRGIVTKSFPFAVVIVLAALVLAACGGGGDGAPANAALSAIALGSPPPDGAGGADPGAPAGDSMGNSNDM